MKIYAENFDDRDVRLIIGIICGIVLTFSILSFIYALSLGGWI